MSPGPDGRKDILPIDTNDKNCGAKGCFIAGLQDRFLLFL
jgi:hypothetical protein